jgi:hypothetical protein
MKFLVIDCASRKYFLIECNTLEKQIRHKSLFFFNQNIIFQKIFYRLSFLCFWTYSAQEDNQGKRTMG